MSTLKKTLVVGVTTLAAVGGTLMTAAPASAATYGGQCGSGYVEVNRDHIGNLGTVFLTYNSSNGNNCVVTIRNSPGAARPMMAAIARQSDPAWYEIDEGNYTTYAGPVYRYARGECVTWGGAINGQYGGDENTNCG
ncbi:spore-associated protein A [Marinactinospora rubrisoli]|uniref:Spore-associated protein A n=1 Tax=Marinactinospora rubrisoli TaxID=2715399 RepID=A0ABW2KHA4_9ACTN